MSKFLKKKWKKYIFQGIFVILFIVFAFFINFQDYNISEVEHIVEQYGYIGLFLGGIITGFNLIVPIPIITLFPFFVQIGLQPVLTVIIISLGMVLGDLLGFFIGKMGRDTLKIASPKYLKKLNYIENNYPRGALFFLFLYISFVPAPNELVVIPLSILGISLKKIVPIMVAGNLVFNSLIAFGLWQTTGIK